MRTRSSDAARRGEARNEGTVVFGAGANFDLFDGTAAGSLAFPPSFEELFLRHYDVIRGCVLGNPEPGYVAVAIDARGPQGSLSLRADGALRSGIIGRHEQCGLFLPDDDAMSLRHVAVLVRDGRVRVIDLRTTKGFEDESGRHLRAVVADGPLFVTLARTRIFLLPTGSRAEWPADSTAGWAALPSRLFADARPLAEKDPVASLTQLVRLARPRHASGREVTVTALSGAVGSEDFCQLAAPGDEISGHLALSAQVARATVSIGRTATERGVLFGRYPRCDLPEFLKSDDSVSRVHALMIRDRDEIHLVDCASTNGTEIDGQPASNRALGHRALIRMGLRIEATWEATG